MSHTTISREEKCLICLESFCNLKPFASKGQKSLNLTDQGTFCSNYHFICNHDLRQYCDENVFTKLYEVRKEKAKFLCPIPDCNGTFDPVIVFSLLERSGRIRYLTLINDIVMNEEPRLSKISNALREMLTLSCPSCRFAVDPSPDACAAILCLNCSSYYCNYCFDLFNSGDTAQDKAACHVHAATHQPNYRVDQPSDPFLSAEVVAGGHKKYREKRLLQSLQLILTAREYQGDAFHLAALSTVLCAQDLQELDLSPLEVWFSALNEVNPFLFSEGGDELEGSAEGAGEETSSATDQPPSLSRASSANTRGGGAGPGGNHSGKILANAILSQNETAIRQILSAFGGHLDVTHRETVVIEDADHSRIAYPLLTLAVLKGYDWLAIHLLELGADVFQRDNQFGRSCLMIICEKAAVAVLDFLWSQPHRFAIDWNRPLTDEPNQYTALQVFARFGHGFLLRRFLSAAGPVALDQAEGFHGYSPLSTALLSGQIPTAIELVLLGADVYHAAQARGVTPLHIAVERGQLQVLRVMERRFRQNNNVNLFFSSLKPTDRDGFKALHVAIEYEQNHLLPFLLDELRADVNDVDNLDRLSPFAMAVLYGNIVAAKKLLTYPQLDIFHSFFDRNRLPTFTIIERGYTDILRIILQRHPQIVSQSCDADQVAGLRPLIIALQFKQYGCLQLLLEAGADVHEVEAMNGLTSFMIAVLQHDVFAFQQLLATLPALPPLALEPGGQAAAWRRRLAALREDRLLTTFSAQRRNLLYVMVEHNQLEAFGLLWERLFLPPPRLDLAAGMGLGDHESDGDALEALRLAEEWDSALVNELLVDEESGLSLLHAICMFDRANFLALLLGEQQRSSRVLRSSADGSLGERRWLFPLDFERQTRLGMSCAQVCEHYQAAECRRVLEFSRLQAEPPLL